MKGCTCIDNRTEDSKTKLKQYMSVYWSAASANDWNLYCKELALAEYKT